jgi:6-phosphogluconolactonase
VSTTFRSRFAAGSRLALVCVFAVAVAAPAVASTSKNHAVKDQPPGGGAVYTETNDPAGNSVVVFDRAANGTLTKRESVSTGGNGSHQEVGCGPDCPILDSTNAVVVSDNGRLVFAVNAGSNTVSSFRETGAGLKQVDQAASGGTMPESLALHGDLLYVLNVATQNANGTTGNIYGYRFNPSGKLTPVGSSQPLANAAPGDRSFDARAIGFDPTGSVIVVTEIFGDFMTGPPGKIDTFVVGEDGKAGPAIEHPSSDVAPFGFAFDNAGHLIVSNIHDPNGLGTVSTYELTSSGGLTPIDTKPSGGALPCWVVVSNDGRYVYVVNTGAGPPTLINSFGLSSSGSLTPLSPPAGPQPGDFLRTDAALSSDGAFLYVLAPGFGPPGTSASHIEAYRLNSDGSMTFVAATPADANLGVGATGLAAR